jgi:hypothetical protein
MIGAEQRGEVADSMDVRKAILARFHSGELSLDECQAELRRVKDEGRASGKILRSDFF